MKLRTRREMLWHLAVASLLPSWSDTFGAEPKKRPRVAAIFTSFDYRSHAHVILENFLNPYLFNGRRIDPGVDVSSFYADQTPKGDMAHQVSRQYGIPICPTIDQALCLGSKKLAVDAVLCIGEHGRYPVNSLGQIEYPRKRFFDEIVAVMRRSGRFVPLYNDKHLSYRWDWAKQMYEDSRKLGIPLMAGSSVPLAQRKPPLELPSGIEIAEAVSIHGGPPESYDFHALEVLQSIVEFRKGGETGLSSVEFLQGDAFWNAAGDGRWSASLAEAAMAAELGNNTWKLSQLEREKAAAPHALMLAYKDGLRACVLKIGSSGTRWNFACRLKDDPRVRATHFYVGPWQNRNLFKALSNAIQVHFRQGKAPYPVERTLLVTGALEAAMRSRAQARRIVATPHLEFSYAARDFSALREMGQTWKLITEDTPEPPGLDSAERKEQPAKDR